MRETHAFRGIFSVSRRETFFLTHFGQFWIFAISQVPEGPQKSMTYQNACTKVRDSNSVIGLILIQTGFDLFYIKILSMLHLREMHCCAPKLVWIGCKKIQILGPQIID